MAGELIHSSVGTAMTQAEFEAVGLHVCNNQATGDLIYASSAIQLSRLAIGAADTVLTCNGTIPAWSATPILNTAVAKGTWTASGTWTIPAVTLGGTVTANAQAIAGIANLQGSTGATTFYMYGQRTVSAGNAWGVLTHDAADVDTARMLITGHVDTATCTWAAITHINLNLGDYLGLFKTDTDSAVEAELWYDDSENVLKYYNGTIVKTIATV